ncbi:MAG: endonuclease Q family protein [Candidatus Ranarchaeia archaeon]|jgi:uncharacterized protein (TIGR00375 family)
MHFFLDFHIHSRYSRGCSNKITPKTLIQAAGLKGLDLLGTGDILHPRWRQEIEGEVMEVTDGIYELREEIESPVGRSPQFILTVEVACNFPIDVKLKSNTTSEPVIEKKSKLMHIVLLIPNFDVVDQVVDVCQKYGNLAVDGRAILQLSCEELIDLMRSKARGTEIIPAHIWTPYFSVLGGRGFDSLNACFNGKEKHLLALETGMSADPPMCWRVQDLTKYPLVSSSDAHSANPLRLGRESTVFSVSVDGNGIPDPVSFPWIINAIKKNGKDQRLVGTIETDPGYGKYHFTGHRGDRQYGRKDQKKDHGEGISVPPKKALELENKCPICKGKMTIGVTQRVERLADNPEGHEPPNKRWFLKLVPFIEVLQWSLGVKSPFTKAVFELYNDMTWKTGGEFNLMLNTPIKEIQSMAGKEVANVVNHLRNGKLHTKPGYDGLYGVTDFTKMAHLQ